MQSKLQQRAVWRSLGFAHEFYFELLLKNIWQITQTSIFYGKGAGLLFFSYR